MEMITAVAILPDINHSSANDPIAQDADAPVIQRVPLAMTVGFLQYGQSIL
jgi:hypothetical protein